MLTRSAKRYMHLHRHRNRNGAQTGVLIKHSHSPEQVLCGSREWLLSVLMTALATNLALLPLAFFGNIPGHEIVRPTAIVILVPGQHDQN
jgi:Cu/Ag efflux pump CusA